MNTSIHRRPGGSEINLRTETLLTRYGERAYRLARRITGSGQDAEEVVQDAFWIVTRKIDTFRGESAFGSWLYRIVANAAYQKLRGRPSRRHDISLDEVLSLLDQSGRHIDPAIGWSPRRDDPSVEVELRLALTAAIDELPAACRVALVLRDVEGRSNSEIAKTLGLNIPIVKTRVHRARLLMRKRLTDCTGTSRGWNPLSDETHPIAIKEVSLPPGSAAGCGTGWKH